MQPQNLFIVRPTLGTGGADRITVTLLEHLPRDRFKPTLVLIRERGELLSEVPPDVDVISLGAVSLGAGSLGARGILTAVPALKRLLAQRRPDIVFSTSGGANVTVALAAHRSGARIVLSERNGLVRDQPWFKRWALVLAKRFLYPRADCVTAVSAGVAGDLSLRLGLPRKDVRVVHNPVVTSTLHSQAQESVAEPWFDDDVPVLLGAGRLVHAKGFDLLLEAVVRLRRESECRLIVLGDGPLRGQLRARAAALGIAEAVKLPGFVTNPYAFMSRCSAFVLPSRFEGLPGVLIQAMACGAAVVAADCPFGPSEIVTSGEDGILVPTGDSSALAEALLPVLEDPVHRQALGAAAQLSAQRYTLEATMPHYVRALDPSST